MVTPPILEHFVALHLYTFSVAARGETPKNSQLFRCRRCVCWIPTGDLVRRLRETGRAKPFGAQSDTNPSPCYSANIRVFFEKNSDPAARNAEKRCSTGIS